MFIQLAHMEQWGDEEYPAGTAGAGANGRSQNTMFAWRVSLNDRSLTLEQNATCYAHRFFASSSTRVPILAPSNRVVFLHRS
jgi:hypothetical protein